MSYTRKIYRPRPGWKQISGQVWEHTSGARIHTIGMVRMPNGKRWWINNWTESQIGHKMIAINGGNRKRGLMAWAVSLVELGLEETT